MAREDRGASEMIGLAVQLDAHETHQYNQDMAVAYALGQLETALRESGRMPEDVGFMFCDDPRGYGISLEMLAKVEQAAYRRAGIEHRAEGISHFTQAYRGFVEHGQLRVVALVRRPSSADQEHVEPQVLAWFDFFDGRGKHLDEEYAAAAASWQTEVHVVDPALSLPTFVVSKLVAGSDMAFDRRTVGLPGRALATVLRALASTTPAGGFFETVGQPDTQRLVARHLQQYVPEMQVFWQQATPPDAAGAAPAKILTYIPAVSSANE